MDPLQCCKDLPHTDQLLVLYLHTRWKARREASTTPTPPTSTHWDKPLWHTTNTSGLIPTPSRSRVGTFTYLVWEWSVELRLIGYLISDFVNKGI